MISVSPGPDAHFLAQSLSMQLKCNALRMAPLLDASNSFRLESCQYLARPAGLKARLQNTHNPVENETAFIVTFFHGYSNQKVDADRLRAWRADLFDQDDVFHPAYLQHIIFGGADNIHLDPDVESVFESWETINVSFAPHLEIIDGPYLVQNGEIYSVWRVYEDSQLAFVQSIWPSLENERYVCCIALVRAERLIRRSVYMWKPTLRETDIVDIISLSLQDLTREVLHSGLSIIIGTMIGTTQAEKLPEIIMKWSSSTWQTDLVGLCQPTWGC